MRFWLLILVLPAAIVLPFEIKTFPSESVLVLNGSSVDPAETKEGVKSYSIDPDGELLLLRAPGYRDLYLNPERIVAGVTEFKLERMDTDFIFQNLVNAGRQPKSVRFSPDGRFWYQPFWMEKVSLFLILKHSAEWRVFRCLRSMPKRKVLLRPCF